LTKGVMRVVFVALLLTLSACGGVFGPPEESAPIEDRAHPRNATVSTAPATGAKTTPLPEQPRFVRGALTPPGAAQGAHVVPAPQLAMTDKSRATDLPTMPLAVEPLPLDERGAESLDDELGQAPSLVPTAPTLSPAVQSLVTAANTAAARHDWDQAQAALERAVKLAPTKSSVWQQLAKAHLQSGDVQRAREVAQRALSLATADGREDVAAWRLIADIEQARGDSGAAQLARATATRLTR
jgi:Tetratricopeptide repeat